LKSALSHKTCPSTMYIKRKGDIGEGSKNEESVAQGGFVIKKRPTEIIATSGPRIAIYLKEKISHSKSPASLKICLH